jgi:hypothetical protein
VRANGIAVRDLVVTEALEGLATEAGERLRELLRSGEELSFDVAEPTDDSPFCQFAPQTERFIHGHATAVGELESFGPACSALVGAGLAGPYLDSLGEPVPPDPGRRAADAVLAFLCRLWEGSADFSLQRGRLEAALRELEDLDEPRVGEAEVIVPLLGLQLPITRLELSMAALVRAETVDAPREATRTEGGRRSAWEPLFLAAVRRPVAPPTEGSGEREEREGPGPALRRLVTALRLFKPGGVGLGPYAWARSPGDRWRRIATGAPRPRAGGYWLTEDELGDLVDFSRALAAPSCPLADHPGEGAGPNGGLARAVSRFEAGLERPSLLDALSDYILALRIALEGGGPAGLGLTMRAAALRGTGEERKAARLTVERALDLERSLVRGDPVASGHRRRSPLELVVELESIVRALLRDAGRGRLGTNLRAAADEILLADGLAAGEGAAAARGTTAEWEAIDLSPSPEQAPEESPEEPERKHDPEAEEDAEMPSKLHDNRISSRERAGSNSSDGSEERDWLSDVDSSETLDWPERPAALKLLDRRPAERKAARERVQHLFPRPDTTEWSVRELEYDRRRPRAKV